MTHSYLEIKGEMEIDPNNPYERQLDYEYGFYIARCSGNNYNGCLICWSKHGVSLFYSDDEIALLSKHSYPNRDFVGTNSSSMNVNLNDIIKIQACAASPELAKDLL